jgi:hypothetical protein
MLPDIVQNLAKEEEAAENKGGSEVHRRKRLEISFTVIDNGS